LQQLDNVASTLNSLAFGELADARPAGWRFAHPGEPAELANVPLGDGRLTVTAADRLVVTLDGVVLLDAAPGVVITGYRRTAREVVGEASGEVLVRTPAGALVRANGRFRLTDTEGGTPE